MNPNVRSSLSVSIDAVEFTGIKLMKLIQYDCCATLNESVIGKGLDLADRITQEEYSICSKIL